MTAGDWPPYVSKEDGGDPVGADGVWPPPRPTPDNDYLDTDEIAAMLKVHRTTVLRHFREGTLPGRKIGHHWRTTRRALDDFVEGHNPVTGATRGGAPIETKDAP